MSRVSFVHDLRLLWFAKSLCPAPKGILLTLSVIRRKMFAPKRTSAALLRKEFGLRKNTSCVYAAAA